MCRIIATAGPTAVTLGTVLYDLPRSLQEMAFEPREQQSGRINVDGTGVVWFDDVPGPDGRLDPRPLRYRTAQPPWADTTLAELAPRLRSRVVLGAVRSATPGIPLGQAFVHPFTAGGLAGTHNGWVSDFRTRLARPLLAEVSDDAFAAFDGMSDSAVLFLLALDARRAGAGLLDAARHATDLVVRTCQRLGATATLTLVLAERDEVVAVNAATGRPANSLYLARDGDGRSWLASEPSDPGLAWEPVPPGGSAVITPTNQVPPSPDLPTAEVSPA